MSYSGSVHGGGTRSSRGGIFLATPADAMCVFHVCLLVTLHPRESVSLTSYSIYIYMSICIYMAHGQRNTFRDRSPGTINRIIVFGFAKKTPSNLPPLSSSWRSVVSFGVALVTNRSPKSSGGRDNFPSREHLTIIGTSSTVVLEKSASFFLSFLWVHRDAGCSFSFSWCSSPPPPPLPPPFLPPCP